MQPIFKVEAITPEDLIAAYRTPRMRDALDRANGREADTIAGNLTRATSHFSAGNKPRFTIVVRGINREIYTTNEIFRIWNYGAKKHVIRPRRRGGRLSFVWKGRRRFFAYVNHPGWRGSHVLEKEAAESRKRFPRVMREEIARNVRGR